MPTIEQITEVIYATMPLARRDVVVDCAISIFNLIEQENKLKPIYHLYLYPEDCFRLFKYLISDGAVVSEAKIGNGRIDISAKGEDNYEFVATKLGDIFITYGLYQNHLNTRLINEPIKQFINKLGYSI